MAAYSGEGVGVIRIMISIVAAMALNRAIGFNNRLLYWLPDDLKRFKSLTIGHTIVMGRKTFLSFPKGALPKRTNIVLSRSLETSYPGTIVFHSLEEALEYCKDEAEVFVIGGESIYQQVLPLANRLYLTVVEDNPLQADAFFPEFDINDWEMVACVPHEKDENHRFRFLFKDFVRK